MKRYKISSWNGKFELRFGKKWTKVYRDNTEIIAVKSEELEREGKTIQEYIKELVKPDIYHFGEFKIRYYLWMVDEDDFEKVKREIARRTEKNIKEGKLPPGTKSYLAIDSKTNEPVIKYFGRDEKGLFFKNEYIP